MGGGLGRTVGVDADGGGEGGEEFYVDDDSGDGCGDGAGGGVSVADVGKRVPGECSRSSEKDDAGDADSLLD